MLKKFLYLVASRGLIVGVVLTVVFSFTLVYGIWQEPANPPPAGSVVGALTESPLYQKRGALGVKDMRIDDVGKWMSELWQLKLFGGSGLGGDPYTLLNVSGATLGSAYENWITVTIDPNSALYPGLNNIAGAEPVHIKNLRIRMACREAYVWLFAPPTSTASNPFSSVSFTPNILTTDPYAKHTACAAENDDWDIQTLTLPVSQVNSGDPIELHYRVLATDSGGDPMSATLQIVGMDYTHQ